MKLPEAVSQRQSVPRARGAPFPQGAGLEGGEHIPPAPTTGDHHWTEVQLTLMLGIELSFIILAFRVGKSETVCSVCAEKVVPLWVCAPNTDRIPPSLPGARNGIPRLPPNPFAKLNFVSLGRKHTNGTEFFFFFGSILVTTEILDGNWICKENEEGVISLDNIP